MSIERWAARHDAIVTKAVAERRLYLEGNGSGSHRLASDLDGDARRQNEMVLDGWRPIELTWRMTDAEIGLTLCRFLG